LETKCNAKVPWESVKLPSDDDDDDDNDDDNDDDDDE